MDRQRFLYKRRKGIGMSVKTLATIVLGIMVIVAVYGATTGWFRSIGDGFVGNVQYPSN